MKRKKAVLNKKLFFNKEIISLLQQETERILAGNAGANNDSDSSNVSNTTVCTHWPPAASVCTHWPTTAQ